MKIFNLSLITLTTLMLVSCGGTGSKGSSSSDSTSTSDSKSSTTLYKGKIAFIRMDTLMQKYGLFIDMSDTFNKKQAKFQQELSDRGRGLENEAMELQEKAQKGLITRFQAQSTEEGLKKKQSDIMAYRDTKMRELAQEESSLSANISKTILDFLKEYNEVKGYSMILQTANGSPIILADPALDITSEVLEELNKRYKESLAAKK